MGGSHSLLLPNANGVGALFVGGKRALEDAAFMERIGASISLGLTVVDPEKHPSVARRVRVSAGDVDEDAASIGSRFAELVQFIHLARLEGLNVYVHCAMGVSRSVTICAAYLLAAHPDRFDNSVTSVLEWIRLFRPQAKPNAGLLLELEKWSQARTTRPSITPRLAADATHVRSSPQPRERIVGLVEKRISAKLSRQASAAAELWLQHEERTSVPTVLEFSRDFVSASRPMLLRQACDPDVSQNLFSPSALSERHGQTILAVDATPDGRADALCFQDGVSLFAQPERRHMTLNDFFMSNKKTSSSHVLYCSSQNDSLRVQIPHLEFELREHCFRQRSLTPLPDQLLAAFAPAGPHQEKPRLEALNLWIGNADSVTSAHRDRAFDNLYLVLHGTKTFYLLPPTAPAWLPSVRAQRASWCFEDDALAWKLLPDESGDTVSWLKCDLAAAFSAREESDISFRPIQLKVNAGDLLYIPAGWVHEVHQSDDTVAANWWFEARFDDARYSSIALADAISEVANDMSKNDASAADRS